MHCIDDLPLNPIGNYLRLINTNIVQFGLLCNIPIDEIHETKQKANKMYIRFRRNLL